MAARPNFFGLRASLDNSPVQPVITSVSYSLDDIYYALGLEFSEPMDQSFNAFGAFELDDQIGASEMVEGTWVDPLHLTLNITMDAAGSPPAQLIYTPQIDPADRLKSISGVEMAGVNWQSFSPA